MGKDTGYRPMPRDFPETFIRVGWDSIEEAMRANKRTIRRWLAEYGAGELEKARRAALEVQYGAEGKRVPGRKPGFKANRYVLGRTLTAINRDPGKA